MPADPSAEQIWFRNFSQSQYVKGNVTNCITNATNKRAIVDGQKGNCPALTIFMDTGAADIDVLPDSLEADIANCIKNTTALRDVLLYGHNTYALVGDYETDEEYDDHFLIFRHGYPINYDKDYESYGDPDNESINGSVTRGNGNWPDHILSNQ